MLLAYLETELLIFFNLNCSRLNGSSLGMLHLSEVCLAWPFGIELVYLVVTRLSRKYPFMSKILNFVTLGHARNTVSDRKVVKLRLLGAAHD